MTKATDKLLSDHRMIRKLLEGLSLENPRFPEILKVLQRALISHAWFEDVIFLPVFVAEPLMDKRFAQEITQEHLDLDYFLKSLRETPLSEAAKINAYLLQTRSILETHFKKEEEGLFPLAEKILDSEGLNHLGDEMERRKTEVRDLCDRMSVIP